MMWNSSGNVRLIGKVQLFCKKQKIFINLHFVVEYLIKYGTGKCNSYSHGCSREIKVVDTTSILIS